MNLAGIIPIAGQKLDYGFPWEDCMIPIAKDYVAIERSVTECLYAGCKTIWIIGSIEQQPLIRHRLGDRGKDSESFNPIRHGTRDRDVCFYYIPIMASDYTRRNSIVWSSIFGPLYVNKAIGRISKNLIPEKFYISFPFGVYDPKIVRSCRKQLKLGDQQVVLRGKNGTVMDGMNYGLTLHIDQAKELEYVLKQKAYESETKFAARHFSVKDIYSHLNLREKVLYLDIPEAYNIDSWDDYQDFLRRSNVPLIKRHSLLPNKEWNGVGVDD